MLAPTSIAAAAPASAASSTAMAVAPPSAAPATASADAKQRALIGLRGLTNLGNTCFMNCVLQVFLHCPPIAHFFLADNHNRFECMTRAAEEREGRIESPDAGQLRERDRGWHHVCLACEMDQLFTQCFSGKRTPYSPHSFLHAMWSAVEHFAGYEQQDAHEFLIAALEAIDAGLASPRRPLLSATSPRGPSPGKPGTLRVAGASRDVLLPGHALQRIFTGTMRSDVTCLKCRSKSTKYEEFHDVSLDIARNHHHNHRARSSSRGSGGSVPSPTAASITPPPPEEVFANGSIGDEDSEDVGGSGNYHPSLAACLRSFTRHETMGATERCWCASCNSLQESTKQLSVQKLPNVLCFHLKRFEHSARNSQVSTKIDAFVEFPLLSLNMRPHTSDHVCAPCAKGGGGAGGAEEGEEEEAAPLEPLPEQLYDLFGVAVHHGTIQHGHYTCYVRRNAQWYHCDDAVITPASEEEVRGCKGYLLFYAAKRLS